METNRFETEKIIPIKGRLSSNAAAKPNTIGKRAEGRKASSSSQLISFLSLSLSLSLHPRQRSTRIKRKETVVKGRD
jgi:hypothetical protein